MRKNGVSVLPLLFEDHRDPTNFDTAYPEPRLGNH